MTTKQFDANMSATLYELIDSLRDCKQMEAHKNCSKEDLQRLFWLSKERAEDLYYLIQREHTCIPAPDKVDPISFVCLVTDALHSNLDGWDSEHDRITIRRFIDEICLQARKNK